MLNELKEFISDWKEIVKDEGILMGVVAMLAVIALCILSLPILPFYILNEWSKTWFK